MWRSGCATRRPKSVVVCKMRQRTPEPIESMNYLRHASLVTSATRAHAIDTAWAAGRSAFNACIAQSPFAEATRLPARFLAPSDQTRRRDGTAPRYRPVATRFCSGIGRAGGWRIDSSSGLFGENPARTGGALSRSGSIAIALAGTRPDKDVGITVLVVEEVGEDGCCE